MDVEPLGLETGEATDDALELVADFSQMVQSLFEAEVVEVVGAEFVAQEYRKLLVLPENGIAEVGAEHMMAVFDLINDGGEVAAVVTLEADAKTSAMLCAVNRHKPSSQLRSNSLWMGKLRLKTKLRQYSI